LCAVGHFHESESPQASAELIANQIHFSDCSILSKSLSKIIFTGTEGKISHVDIQASFRPFGDIEVSLGPQKHQTTGAALEAGFLSAGSSVKLGHSNCTTVAYFVPVG
jgi:hypothetical protein